MASTGLTPFLVAMLKADRAALARADVGKLAVKYGIPVEWVRFNLEWWRARV